MRRPKVPAGARSPAIAIPRPALTDVFSRRLPVRRVLVFLASVGVGLVAACGGKVIVDTAGSGGQGGAGGASTASTTAAVTSGTPQCATGGTLAGGTGVGGNGSTTNCETCNAFLTSGPNG